MKEHTRNTTVARDGGTGRAQDGRRQTAAGHYGTDGQNKNREETNMRYSFEGTSFFANVIARDISLRAPRTDKPGTGHAQTKPRAPKALRAPAAFDTRGIGRSAPAAQAQPQPACCACRNCAAR